MKNALKVVSDFIAARNPVNVLIGGYLLLAAFGAAFLCLPWLQKIPTQAIDNLFISASAVSTTGLATVSISDHYSALGQLIVILLIQIGGIGYMSFGSFVLLTRETRLKKYQEEMVKIDFGLPDDFDLHTFIRSMIIFCLGIELAGTAALFFIFRAHGVGHPLWNAVFHSISAFCTAGFSLFNTSFENFADDPLLNTVIFILSFFGAIGFIVLTDFWQKITGQKKQITLTSKIILIFTILVIFIGSLLLMAGNSYHSDAGFAGTGCLSVFQSMSALTTVGFNTVPLAEMSHGALYLLTILMIMGASPAGTGGGIKSTTIVAVLTQMYWTLRGKKNVTFMGYEIPQYRLRLASASFTFYILLLTVGIYLLSLSDSHSIFEVIFEATSALGTVGLSMGITPELTYLSKIIVIALMMLGRIGPLTIGLALFYDKDRIDNIGWQEDVVL